MELNEIRNTLDIDWGITIDEAHALSKHMTRRLTVASALDDINQLISLHNEIGRHLARAVAIGAKFELIQKLADTTIDGEDK